MLNPDKVKLAIAPIGWTNDDMPDLGAENTFEQCISEMGAGRFLRLGDRQQVSVRSGGAQAVFGHSRAANLQRLVLVLPDF